MTQPVAAGNKFMQEVNAAAILAALRQQSPLSVAAVAASVGLSRQAVSRSLAVLVDDGYVEFLDPDRGVSRTGRPAQLVRFRAEVGYVIGVDVRRKRIRALLVDLAGQQVATWSEPHNARLGLPHSLGNAITNVIGDAAVSPEQIWHVTVSAPGIVDPARSVVTLIPGMPAARGDVLVAAVHAIVGCPVYIDNDVKLAAQGERWHGKPRDDSSFVFIDWGEQIGAGIVIGGELYRGFSNDAGDIGYLELLDPAVAPPAHGRLGSFERYAGTGELLRLAGESRGQRVTLADIAVGLDADAAWATDAVRAIAGRFALVVKILRAVLDPQTVVIGGEMAAHLGETLAGIIRETLASSPLTQPDIEVSQLGDDAGIRGAVHQSLTAVIRERFEIQTLAVSPQP